MNEKFERLLSILKELQSVVVAFSGGVDSTFLLSAVKESGVPHLAVTAFSETMAESELRAAESMAGLIGARHVVIRTREIGNPDFVRNSRDRCFYCKDELFSRLLKIADEEGYRHVIDGSNSDDLSDWRPGRRAALKHGVRSPLTEAGFTKSEIRESSRARCLPTWSKPASPCLSSRFPYGQTITRDALKRVERAEEYLKSLGFTEFRVRIHHDGARIELKPEEMEKAFHGTARITILKRFEELGFANVCVDLEGFRSGRLNE